MKSGELDVDDVVLEPEGSLTIRADAGHIGGSISIARNEDHDHEADAVSFECHGTLTDLNGLPAGSYSMTSKRDGESASKRSVSVKQGERSAVSL